MAVFDDGGYSAGSRVRFGVVALAAAAAAWASDPPRARRLAAAPPLLVLFALAALGALSATWTVGLVDEALEWGLVTAGFAAVAFAGAVLVSDARTATLAAGLVAVVAVAMGLIGLVAAALTDEPLAHRAAGLWRPASTFQYSPALALLVVSALPPILTALCRGERRWQQLLAGAGAAVAGATLALAESRTQLGFALVVCATALLWPQRLLRAPRGTAAAAVALVAAAGLGAYAVAGGYVPVTPPPDGERRLILLGAVIAACTAAWPLVRIGLRRGTAPLALVAALLALAGAAAIAKPAPRLISSGIVSEQAKPRPAADRPSRRLDPIRDRLLHGRLRLWGEALATFGDRPLQGGGADSYFFASAEHQDTRSVFFAHSLPLELAAELGLAGLLLALALYASAIRALWRARAGPAAWLLGPAATAFLAANLVDWPWHLAGSGAVWALAFGAILSNGRRNSERPLGLSRACQGAKEIE